MKHVLLVLSSVALLQANASPPVIANRAPNPDEVGYRPEDGATVSLNPPSFTWLHENGAASYEVEWRPADGDGRRFQVAGVPWNTYTHSEPLKPGTYLWRYRCRNAAGEVSNWSKERSVVVPRDATLFPMPTRTQQRGLVPAKHPRLFLRPEDLPRLRELASGREKQRFAPLRQEADRIIDAGPTPEPEHMGSARDKDDKEAVKYWWPNRTQTEKACLEAETLAFVYLLTGDRKYGEAARKWVMHLASWNPDGPTNFRLNCEAGKPMLFRPARAYDWAWDMFAPDEREKIRAVTQRRIKDAWESGEVGRGTGHLNRPFNSHGNRVWHKIGEAGIAFLDEIPEAEQWLDYAVNKFFACYPIWADEDGGWHEGVSYWSGYMSKAVWWLQVAHSALKLDGTLKPFFAHVGDYPLYIAPPHSPNSGFGDLSFRPPSSGSASFLDYHVRVKGNQPGGGHAGYWRWWMNQWGMKGPSGILGFLYAANLPEPPPARPPSDLPPSKVFHGIGVASLHTTLLDSREDVHFLFKSSPFGTQSHGHNPHNTFQLNAYGAELLSTCVYRDLHGSKFHYQWAHSTVAHNGLLVNGEGQIKHTPAPHGRIAAEQLTRDYDYIMGEAAAAYGTRLARYNRHVLFLKKPQPLIVILDDVAAREPATFQFMLHGFAEFTVDESQAMLQVQQPNAGLVAQYLSPVPLQFRQWSGYQPPPDRDFPNQWHVEAGTKDRLPGITMLTILRPYKMQDPGPNLKLERLESDTAVGIRVNDGEQTRVLGFRKTGIEGSAELGGNRFSGPVLTGKKT